MEDEKLVPVFDIFSLTRSEVDVLVETIDHQVQRLQESKVAMIHDRATLDTEDLLLDAMAGADADISLLTQIRYKLERRGT